MTTKRERIDALRAALAEYDSGRGTGLFDHAHESDKAAVRSRALGLLNHRRRSRAELRQRLIDAEFPEALVTEVIDDLERVGLIDDADFAAEWVRQRRSRRGKSTRVLEQELRAKGVDASVRAEALANVSDADEAATAEALARKKARTITSVPGDYAERQRALRRIVGVLARRGFGEGLSLRIAQQALDDRLAELADSTG
ncbi:regulatory protein RecX [Corynebacterium uterequi]|uniref:Regulatory protein RecX n=1 Tax=Corynebacterium uterequi TaxID=1072256 RepID=A0A0G3HDB0_9CORY|nr:regulatory protein RecX [Corynebacterium uterequi]AKK11299.1 hypothetical protein CUTER_06550 [Corynebacterium uterequi]